MAVPFCTACGATIAAGTRFCVKCGQPVGEAAPPPVPETPAMIPPAPPVPPIAQTAVYMPPPPPPVAQPIAAQPVKDGAGAGVWIGILGILLLVGGAGLWFYTTHLHGSPASTVQVASTPPPAAQTQPLVAAPAPSTTPEVPPPNPDLAQKDPAPAVPAEPSRQPVPARPVDPRPAPQPTVTAPQPTVTAPQPTGAPPVKPMRQTSGVLHAAVEVAQNGEVVFENLPGARLRFTFDRSAWQPTISHQPNGTQTLVMRSLKPGLQTSCDVRWEIVQ